jgi:hypothetical protein
MHIITSYTRHLLKPYYTRIRSLFQMFEFSTNTISQKSFCLKTKQTMLQNGLKLRRLFL